MPTLARVGPEAFDGPRLRRAERVGVAFLADWCPFCRSFEPEFAALAATAVAPLLIADLTSLSSPLWDRFAIEIVPTVVVFDRGEPIFRADGVSGEGLGPADLRAIADALRGPLAPPDPANPARSRPR